MALVPAAGAEPVALGRRVATQGDVRNDGLIGQHVLAFLAARRARTVVRSPGIIGCLHEEGVDYADGGECPQCPYWHGRDRWARSGA